MYSFGIILYEVYSRKEPYENEDPMTVLEEVADPSVNRRPPIPSTCPSQIMSLMEDCLAGKPEQRPTFEEVDLRLKRVEVKASRPEQRDDSFDCGRSSNTSVTAGSRKGMANNVSGQSSNTSVTAGSRKGMTNNVSGRSSNTSVTAGSRRGVVNSFTDSTNPPVAHADAFGSGVADFVVSSLVYRCRNRNQRLNTVSPS